MKNETRDPPEALSSGTDKDGDERNEKAAISSRQSYRGTLDLAMRPVRPEPKTDVVRVCQAHDC